MKNADLTEKQQGPLGGVIKKAFIAFKRGEWKLSEEAAGSAEQTCWKALEGQKWDHVAWRESYIYSQLVHYIILLYFGWTID